MKKALIITGVAAAVAAVVACIVVGVHKYAELPDDSDLDEMFE